MLEDLGLKALSLEKKKLRCSCLKNIDLLKLGQDDSQGSELLGIWPELGIS